MIIVLSDGIEDEQENIFWYTFLQELFSLPSFLYVPNRFVLVAFSNSIDKATVILVLDFKERPEKQK